MHGEVGEGGGHGEEDADEERCDFAHWAKGELVAGFDFLVCESICDDREDDLDGGEGRGSASLERTCG